MYKLSVFLLLGLQSAVWSNDVGIFAKAVWLLHAHGRTECVLPENDRQLKSVLAKSLANDGELSFEELSDLMDQTHFASLAGVDNRISEAEIAMAVSSMYSSSRERLTPQLLRHAELLSTSFDMIDPNHHQSIEQLAQWISRNWSKENTLHIITTCTGNSRRSILGAMMGNLAAAHYGFDNIRFHSGGTKPSAFNKRTIATLREIGFEIEPTGQEARRGDPATANPIYHVRWGIDMHLNEFSKSYKDPTNPQSGFAAIMVCSEADAECPTVDGAKLRVAMKFMDPKFYDDGALEQIKYAERRDDIGRTMLATMACARRLLSAH